MEILTGLYRSKRLLVFEDGYGGSPSWKYLYSYLLFRDEKTCYLFYSNKAYEVVGRFNHKRLKPTLSFDDSDTLNKIDEILNHTSRLEYKRTKENEVTFNLPVQTANEQGTIIEGVRVYRATVATDLMTLKLIARDGNATGEILVDEEFELVNYQTK